MTSPEIGPKFGFKSHLDVLSDLLEELDSLTESDKNQQ